jgi:hypothetical protein
MEEKVIINTYFCLLKKYSFCYMYIALIGCYFRRRDKIVSNRKQFRMPSGMGAVERAMRQFCEKKEGHIFELRVGLEFDSEAEAIEFYNLYLWEVGFGVRRGNVDGNKDGYIIVRDVVCQRQVITYRV